MMKKTSRLICLISLLLVCLLAFAGCGETVQPDTAFRGITKSEPTAPVKPTATVDEATGKTSELPSEIPSDVTSSDAASSASASLDVTSDSGKTDGTRTVRVLAVGDNLIHQGVFKCAAVYAKKAGNGASYDFKPIYAGIAADIAAADLSIINQETVFDPESAPANYPQLNTPAEIADDLGALGFDVVSLANNHMMDMGENGLLRSMAKLDTVSGVTRVGAYNDTTDMQNIRVLERGGISIAVVSFTYGVNMGTGSGKVVIPLLTESNVKSQLALAKEKAEFVIAVVHWGDENTYDLTDSQKKYAKLLANEGADAIIGSHPHVIQPIKWVNADDGRKVLCAYSLGNLVSMMAFEKNMLGGVLQFSIVSENGAHPHVGDVQFNPTVFFYLYGPGSGKDWYDNQVYYLSDFTNDLAAKHGIMHYNTNGSRYSSSGGTQNKMTLESLYGLAKKQISAEFLPDYVNNYSE